MLPDSNNHPHVAFYAKSDLRAGQELTFDYRFKEEEASDKVCLRAAWLWERTLALPWVLGEGRSGEHAALITAAGRAHVEMH